MRRYYEAVFPSGSKNAHKNYNSAKLTLKTNAYAGQVSEYAVGVREYHIHRTPFTFVYRVNAERIEVLRVLDNRSGE